MNLDLLSIASVHIVVAFLVVWLVCRLCPRIDPNWRCWLWRLVGLKCILSLWLVTVPISVNRDQVPAPANLMLANGYAPIRQILPATVNVPQSAYRPQVPVQTWRNNKYIRAAQIWTGLSALWWIGFAVILVRFLFAFWRVRNVLRSARPEPAALAALAAIQDRAGYEGVVRVVVAPGLGGPAVVGVRRPTILLPPITPGEDPAILESAIAHELAHIRRNDLAWVIAGEACKAIFWFHPLVWLACREQHAEAEISADRMARSWVGRSPREYGRHLLVWLDRPSALTQSPGLMLSTHELNRRLKAMSLKPYRRSSSVILGFVVAAPLAFALTPFRFLTRAPEPETIVEILPAPGKVTSLVQPKWKPDAGHFDRKGGDFIGSLQGAKNQAIQRLSREGTGGKVYSSALAGGGKVELLGLTHIEAGKLCSWSADGKRLPNILPVVAVSGFGPTIVSLGDGSGKPKPVESGLDFGRQALIRISPGYAGANGDFVNAQYRNAMRYSMSNTLPLYAKVKGDTLLSIEQGFPAEVESADLNLNYYRPLRPLGSAKVKDGVVISSPGLPDAKIISSENAGRYQPIGRKLQPPQPDVFFLSVAQLKNPLDSLRAIVHLKNGQIAPGYHVMGQELKDQADRADRSFWILRGVKLADIAEIRFAVTRHERVVFKNVQLQPRG